MNRLATSDVERIWALVRHGESSRSIRTETGFSTTTIAFYRDWLLAQEDVRCQCGKTVKHQGWCRFRFRRSPRRREFMAGWFRLKRYSKVMYCHRVLLRMCRDRFVPVVILKDAARRLANKHSLNPIKTYLLLVDHPWFYVDSLGAIQHEAVYTYGELAMKQSPNAICCPVKAVPCAICRKPALHNGTEYENTCGGDWCNRLYAFYYVEGRSRPPSVRGGKNNGLRFEFLLSDYIKRYANETSTKHSGAARCAVRGMGSSP